MTIHCDSIDHFVLIIGRLVEAGLTFEAHSGPLTITLTGGY